MPHPAVVKRARLGKKPERKGLGHDHCLVAVPTVPIRGRNGQGACELLHVGFVRDAEPGEQRCISARLGLFADGDDGDEEPVDIQRVTDEAFAVQIPGKRSRT